MLFKNFQLHAEFSAVLDPHCTVFIGSNFKGKSAVLRGIKWVMTNRPTGMAMVGKWGKAAYAFGKLWIDGHTIVRSRGEGINEYKIDGQVKLAPGVGVPQEIADLVNVSEVNFQGQHDGPYWFLIPASEVSRNLNDIINLSSIDESLAAAGADVRKAKAAVDVSVERLREALAQRDRTEWTAKLAVRAGHAQSLFLRFEKQKEASRRIAALVDGVQRAKNTRDDAVWAIAALGKAERLYQSAAAKRAESDAIWLIVQQVYNRERLDRPLPGLGRLQRLRDRAARLRRKSAAISTILFGIENLTWELKDHNEHLESLAARAAEQAGTQCPACGQRLPNSSEGLPPIGTSPTSHQQQEENHARSGMTYKSRRSNR